MTRAPLILCLAWIALRPLAAQEMPEIQFRSTADGSMQPGRLYVPAATRSATPLLVLLHTWSGDYKQEEQLKAALPECQKRAWTVAMPDFRGPNRQPEACASDLAVQDVLDCVEFVRQQTRIDEKRIYLVGASGGGHMALIMAGRAPRLWAGVSAWVPITDLKAWHAESIARNRNYWKDLQAVCGGPPGASADVDHQYAYRSPLTHLPKARGLPIDLNAGIHDGHTGSVPVSHCLRAFNLLAEVNARPDLRLSDAQIEYMTARRLVPIELAAEKVDEPDREHPVLFRRSAGPARVTIFNGGHEGDMPAAIRWLAGQVKR
jgi:pimeloyl-ACP methyl ester carboxylesterase